jgi:bacterioferritin-associated ferredoxin
MVNRCVCYRVPFTEMKEVADANGIRDLETLQQRIFFGFKCGLCRPYVEQMLRTGQTEFEPVWQDDE